MIDAITGTNASLVDDSMADDLHRHSELSASDGTPNPALQVDTIGGLDWLSGNVIYVPLAGSIEAYITAATAGDTLVLASGTYTVTSALAVSKALNIVGQGIGKTTVACATAATSMFTVTASNVRIANMSMVHTSTTGNNYCVHATGIAGTVLIGVVVENVAATMTGAAFNHFGIFYRDAGGSIRDVVVTISAATNCVGITHQVEATAEASTTLMVYNTDVSVSATGTTRGMVCYDFGSSEDTISHLWNCRFSVSGGSTSNYGCFASGSDALVYALDCLFNSTGTSPFDVFSTSSSVIQLRSCVLVNGTTSGTITSSGKVVTDKLYATTNVGIGTTAPDKHLEINVGAATGGIRLTYNDANGSAAVYGDITISSAGVMTLTPVGSTPQIVMGGGVVFPTSDPGIAGVWYDNAGTLTKSTG